MPLFDEATLRLYLANGIYGQHQAAEPATNRAWQTHYKALGDYACLRKGDHVLFFLDRTIVYGGTVLGSETTGSFYINGPNSPMGKAHQAPLVWDESSRTVYQPVPGKPGIFTRPSLAPPPKAKDEGDDQVDDDVEEPEPETDAQKTAKKRAAALVSQPYLIRFETVDGLTGKAITSDDLYFELGTYPYPLPSNSIQGMGFCITTPGEATIALKLLKASTRQVKMGTDEGVVVKGTPTLFDAGKALGALAEEMLEAEIEALCLAKPSLLPAPLRASEDQTPVRQAPISPFKPAQMDRADIAYYGAVRNDGTLPDHIVELKRGKLGAGEMKQAAVYLAWLDKIHGSSSHGIKVSLFGSAWTNSKKVPDILKGRCTLYAFDGTSKAL